VIATTEIEAAPDALGAPPVTRRGRPAGSTSRWQLDGRVLAVAVVAVVAVLLRLPLVLSHNMVHVDEGVYGASVDAMRAGFAPYRDVFSSQGPLFLPVLWIADLVGVGWWAAPRFASAAGGVVLTVACYALVRRRSGPAAATLAAALVTSSGSVVVATSAAITEGVVLGLTSTSVVLAMRVRERPTRLRLASLIACLGCALATKSVFAAPALLAAAVAVGPQLSRRRAVLAAAGVPLVWLALALPWGVGAVWDQSVAYHLEGSTGADPIGSAVTVGLTLRRADALAVVVAGTLLALAIRRRSTASRVRRSSESDGRVLRVWLASTVGLLAIVSPLWHQHVAYLVPPLVVVAFAHAPRAVRDARRASVAAGAVGLIVLALATPVVAGSRDQEDHRVEMDEIVRLLRSTPRGELVVSDLPGLVWLADRGLPPDLVDADGKRIRSGRITAATLADAARRERVCTLVFWSPTKYRTLGFDPTRAGYRIVQRHDLGTHDALVYRRLDCR
jgi:hypothetical protein